MTAVETVPMLSGNRCAANSSRHQAMAAAEDHASTVNGLRRNRE
jgi:hypothetical protein